MVNYLLKIMSVQLKHLRLAITRPLFSDETHDPTYFLFKINLKNQINMPPKPNQPNSEGDLISYFYILSGE